MSDIRNLIDVTNLYNAVLFERDLSNFNDVYLQRAADGTSGRSLVSPEEARAELDRRAAQTPGSTPPQAQTTAPAMAAPQGSDAAPSVSTTSDTAVNRQAPVAPASPTAAPTRGRGDGNAEVDQRRRDRNAADDDAAMAQPVAPAQPGQQTSGLPAKLGQIKSANLMKDYNAGGKKEMQSVKDVQLALSRLGHDPNGIDGKYGPGTFKAVQEFQKANGLSVDGQVGPATIKAMMDKLGGAAPAATASQGDPAADAAQDDAARTAAPAAQSGAGDEAAAQAANAAVAADTDTDSARVEELIAKLDQQPTQQNASIDFGHLIAIVEGRILKEALSQAEVQELQGIIAKHKNNTKFNRELLSRAEAAVAASSRSQTGSGASTPSTTPLKPLDQVKAPDNTVASVSAAPTAGSGNPTPANANAGKPAQPDFAKQARDQEALNKKVQADADAKALGDFGGSQDPTAMRDIKAPAQAAPEPEKNVVRDGSGKVVRSGDGTPVRTRSDNQIWWDQNMQGKPFPGDAAAQKAIDQRKAQGDKNWNSIKNFFGGNKTQQNQSKDLSMKTAMNESASMNVSMTGDNAAEVAELMKLLKNAGMPDAGPVKDIMPPMAPKGDMADFMGMVDSGMQGPAEPCSVCGEVHEETSCSEGTEEYDAIIDEWDNSPKEEYKDHNYMTQDLSGGINRPKKAYAAAQDGDNAMAVEAIKSDLRKALEEALKGK